MANALAAAAKTAYRVFFETLSDETSSWMPLTGQVQSEEPTYVESDVYGVTTYAAQVASPVPKDIISSQSSTAVAAFEETLKFTKKEVRDTPGILAASAQQLAIAGAWTLTKAFWDAVAALDTTTHPEDGGSTYAATGGGTVFFADDFDMTPPNDSAFTQSNLFTDGLSDTAIDAGLAARADYRTKSGTPITGSADAPFLIVPSELWGLADALATQMGRLYDGAGLQLGFAGRLRNVVKMPFTATDANDWFLWWLRQTVSSDGQPIMAGPVMPWLREPPSIRITPSPNSNHIEVVAYMEYAIHTRPWEGDVQMHKIA